MMTKQRTHLNGTFTFRARPSCIKTVQRLARARSTTLAQMLRSYLDELARGEAPIAWARQFQDKEGSDGR